MKDGSLYIGTISLSGRFSGVNGIMIYVNGEIYEGGWVRNKKHFKGKLTNSDKIIHEGFLFEDQYNLLRARSLFPTEIFTSANTAHLMDTSTSSKTEK
jgi:hypothetical protein